MGSTHVSARWSQSMSPRTAKHPVFSPVSGVLPYEMSDGAKFFAQQLFFSTFAVPDYSLAYELDG